MFLKRIELSGFKSFADKTELEFVPGITAVVGPNGSGKSNISDGIRWVLGEQSAKSLRGGKMEDIIFAGSDTRRAVNVSEVSLTLDNGDHALPLDFSEVTVTRRINRSGDSDYFINRQACRLKDITELFMDTGIGKEAYSIIGQGRIEEILSTRAEDRRGIFEEASGIVKYKIRKREAQKKLDETEQNLLRIHDLIAELEDQLDPLREQSEKAIEYKRLKDELKSREISMYVHQIGELHQSWKEAGERCEKLEQQRIELSTIVSAHDAQLEHLRLATRRNEEQLDALQQELLRTSEDFDRTEGQGDVLRERARHLAEQRQRVQAALEQHQRRLSENQAEQEMLQQHKAEIALRLAAVRKQLGEEEARIGGIGAAALREREEELKRDLLDKLNLSAQIRNDIRYCAQQLETLQRRGERLEDDRGKWREREAALRARLEELSGQKAEASREIEEIREQYLAAGEALKAKEKLYAELELTLRRWEQKAESLISRRDTMRELQNDYDGFVHGVREVLKAKLTGGLRGIHGAVAELAKVPAEYETAMETALGGAMQHIVMENEAASREAIQFLKRRQLGRATFLPLDVIRGRSIPDRELAQIRGEEGYVGVAADLVDFDSRYESIIRNLLGNVVIASSLEQANRIAARSGYRYRVVTLEGDVVNAGGSMTGGSSHRKSASLLGRGRMIDKMNEEIAEAETQGRALKDRGRAMKAECAELRERLETLRQSGERKRLEEQRLEAEGKQTASELEALESQSAVHRMDRDAIEQEREEHAARKAELEAELIKTAAEEERIRQAIAAAEAERERSEAERAELQEGLTGLRVQAAELGQQEQAAEAQRLRLADARREIEAEAEVAKGLSERLERETLQNEREQTEQTERRNELDILKRGIGTKIEAKRAERADFASRLEQEQNHTKEQRDELRRTEDELRQTEVKVNRLDVELDNLLKRLSEEYEISFELARERYPVPEDVPGTAQAVRDLKRQIQQLGEVNLGAIEEYQRVGDRYGFLSGQHEDLVAAKTTLYQVIREIEEEMAKRFIETFQAIRSEFTTVFSRLFGGGRADLVLSDPDNLLDTGVDIVAQPPGKKLQNLQLLSGGERALTAMALLFAILRVKPVPFCVLDEVEAALDEANVARFAAYLREFSGSTQFIVVTHRKGTMEEADVLYGVTMEEDGVSKLVSVRLDDEEPATA